MFIIGYGPCARPALIMYVYKCLVSAVGIPCHRYDFLVRLCWNGLNFFELFKNFYSSLGIDHDPYVLYVSFFTRSHGQEKSLSYYDLFNFGVLLIYGRIPTLIFFYLLHNPTTPILPV